ncbi:hypothetical protein ABIB62_001572 [Mucilaginibacter sp. UYP25]|uniref:DUF4435 domain-containing protein n=1 Tax=unclassified Mucilaginibacter TaxID=2617802 RepID=UPI003397A0FB
MMLRYTSKVLPTISLFFKSKSEIDVFIEDSNDEEFYKSLLHRLVIEKVKIDKLISLGCKQRVIAACEADQDYRKRKRLYIVDGDLDLIFDNNRKDLKHLFVLDHYCIENLLIDEDGIIETLHDCVILDKKKITASLGLEKWLKGIAHILVELFLHYSICHECVLGTKTVSIPVATLCKQDKGLTVLDIAKVEGLINTLRTNIIAKTSDEYYNDTIYTRRSLWPSNIESLIKIVSGKDYLLPLLAFRFKKLKGKETYNLKMETLRLRLAKTINLKKLRFLKSALNE